MNIGIVDVATHRITFTDHVTKQLIENCHLQIYKCIRPGTCKVGLLRSINICLSYTEGATGLFAKVNVKEVSCSGEDIEI